MPGSSDYVNMLRSTTRGSLKARVIHDFTPLAFKLPSYHKSYKITAGELNSEFCRLGQKAFSTVPCLCFLPKPAFVRRCHCFLLWSPVFKKWVKRSVNDIRENIDLTDQECKGREPPSLQFDFAFLFTHVFASFQLTLTVQQESIIIARAPLNLIASVGCTGRQCHRNLGVKPQRR